MSRALPTRSLIVQRKALAAAALAIELIGGVRAPLRPIAHQALRPASSVPANIAEGHGRFGKDRAHHYRIAYGSAKEIEVHLQLLLEARAIDPELAAQVLDHFDEVRAMLWRLIHPRA